MIRILLCMSICACTLMTSLELHRGIVRSAEMTRELAETVGRIKAMLAFEAADVFDICQKCFTENPYGGLEHFSEIRGGDFPGQWKKACETLSADSESKRLFRSAADIIGSFDLKTQTERLNIIETSLYRHADSLKKRADDTKKLYTTLGMLSGIGISIVII